MLGCTKTRWSLSAEADGKDRTDKTTKHLARCTQCTAFACSVSRLGNTLQAGAEMAPSPQAEVEFESNKKRPNRKHFAFGGAFVSASALLAVLVIGPQSSKQTQNDQMATASRGDDEVASVSLKPNSDKEIDDSMVETLAGDARGGLRYVLRVSGLQSVDH